MLSTIEAMAKELSGEEKELISVVDPFIVPIVEKRAFCLMRELAFCSGFPDYSLLIGLTLGLPALEWSCKAPTMRVRIAEHRVSLKDLEEGRRRAQRQDHQIYQAKRRCELGHGLMVENNGGGQCERCYGSLQALGRDPLQLGAPAEESRHLGVPRRADGAQGQEHRRRTGVRPERRLRLATHAHPY